MRLLQVLKYHNLKRRTLLQPYFVLIYHQHSTHVECVSQLILKEGN